MREWPAIDSRQYIVAFEFRSADDCPPDFELPSTLAGFDTGLFLPRDDPDWFGRSLYPPRILLLKGRGLHMVSHPSAGEPPRRWELQRISSVESGHMLLKGWLRFTGPGFDCTVRYNTRGFPPVFRFMQSLRDQLLRGARSVGPGPATTFGASLDIKFTNALARELDSGEMVVMQVFQPPRQVRSRSWLMLRRRTIAGDLLALTGRRLLSITDRERGYYSRFGSIVSYAPLDAVVSIGLNNGSTWLVPMEFESRDVRQRIAKDFAAALEIQKRRNGAGLPEIRR
jgi:hypothetical protein